MSQGNDITKETRGYVFVRDPNHTKSKGGYIKRANLVWEQATGHYPSVGEVLHHIDNNRANDDIDNLRLMTKSEHSRFHAHNKTRHYSTNERVDKENGRKIEDYFSREKAARLLHCTRMNIVYHIEVGNLKAVFPSNIGVWLIHKDDLEAFRYGHYVVKEGGNEDDN